MSKQANTPQPGDSRPGTDYPTQPGAPDGPPPKGGHGWMMAFCVAIVVVAIVLAATGVVSGGFVFVAVACMAMMAMMMLVMGRGGGDG